MCWNIPYLQNNTGRLSASFHVIKRNGTEVVLKVNTEQLFVKLSYFIQRKEGGVLNRPQPGPRSGYHTVDSIPTHSEPNAM